MTIKQKWCPIETMLLLMEVIVVKMAAPIVLMIVISMISFRGLFFKILPPGGKIVFRGSIGYCDGPFDNEWRV